MIALGIRYLTKYAVATDLARGQAEWPPHPGRVFMALTAAHFESGADLSERTALEWLETAPVPEIRASDAYDRSEVRTYVPVNDDHGGIIRRLRQDRAFQRTRPDEDCAYLIWRTKPPVETRALLGQLCRKVTRIGHSMSAVQMWVVPEGSEPQPTWIPSTERQDVRLRVASAGTLRALEVAFNGDAIQEYDAFAELPPLAKGKDKTRLRNEVQAKFPAGRPTSRRPQIATWQGYTRLKGSQSEPIADGPFDEPFIVLTKSEGPVLGLESTLQLTGALRNAALNAARSDIPEWLSGHDATGAPSRREHVAFFPLPYVGSEYADGHVLGLGIAVPRKLSVRSGASLADELRRTFGPLFFDTASGEEREISVWWKSVWKWSLERERRERPPTALQRATWTMPSRTWASVTPVVLHHHPKKREGEIERIVREAFVSALLPAPETVTIRSISAVQGAGHAMSVPLFADTGPNRCRFQTHVVARFAQPVRGPMLVGRGRFRGYGLFRPLPDTEALPWSN
jgi:CRISPR-associated protein Csb2